ncbi:hypothetical protein Vadar_004756 [Vaccinium darrowii]|uniref:Uncharacterized protein n=1 Tax=Vaccinium darrowii TaxID=229202 RepID=A0ACB7YJ51_9ERIC|nr:hypothetical protein Vadar_004756 [Vaccinium darrowii]
MCTPECMIAMLGCPAFNEAVKAVIKAGKYARQYRMHVDNLRTELGYLEDARVRIERRVREARDRGEEIENAVTHWQADVGRMENDIQELIGQAEARMHCFACSCPNIKLRYRLGKQAEEKIRDVHRLIEDSHFEEFSHPRSPPPELQFPSAENYVHLDSRIPILEQIVVALRDPNVKMIGVHGLGGVGKTTLVEKVAKKLLDDGTFKQIPLATVSKVLNVKEIQKKLAGKLNFKLEATMDENAIAIELWNKFKNGEQYLVILDDVWEVVDLKAIGIPITDGQRGCKVVLTSRNKDLLEIRMKTDSNFPIAELDEGEAWDLFKKQVGNSMESQPGVESLAREVCQKCKGLPIAIKALGGALEGKPSYMWDNALVKLKRYMLTNIEGISSSVWATLRVSYDMLESTDSKSCFLLCCLFAEDIEISIDDLTRHCVARSLLSQNPRTLQEARDAIRTVVYILKSTSLLSNGSNENVVRIHDVIRDVGISIAREEQAFVVDHGALQWPRNLVIEPSAISFNSGKIRVLPDGLVYPQLHTLIVDNNELSDLEIPDKFFRGMKQLTVLILTRIRMRRLPSSLVKLSNLRMLCLNQCKLADIAIFGDLKTNLEVLSLQGSDIKALPPEMAQLTSLRVLDLRDCDDLKVIPQGIVSNLTNLEELYFADEFDKWEATIDEEKDTSRSRNVSIEEIRLLLNTGQLTTLHIHIPSVTLLPKDNLMLENLMGFRISMGTNFDWDEDFAGTRVLKYGESSLRKEFIPLVNKAEALYLSGIKGLKKVLDYRGVGNEFLALKYLKVESCDDDLEHLLGEPKSSVQSHGPYPFNHLTDLIVEKCKLKYLFSPTTARGLVHLERLRVASCENIREIVGFERQNNENELIGEVKFSHLKQLELQYLPKLISFYAGKEKTQVTTGSSSTLAQPLFNEKVILPVLEELEVVELDSIEEIWDKQSPSVNEKTASFSQLTDVTVKKCEKLMNLGPWNILSRLRNLQRLRVDGCPNVEFIVLFKNGKGEEEVADDSTLIIPLLRHLHIEKMGKLKSFYSSSTTANAQSLFNHQVILPSLEVLEVQALDSIKEIWDKQSTSVIKKTASFSQLRDMTVKKCKELVNLGPANILPRLQNLQRLTVDSCPNVEVIVLFKNGKEEETADERTFIIPQLLYLAIQNMEKLKSFCSSSTTSNAQSLFNHQVCFSQLTSLRLEELPKLVSFCTDMGEAGTADGNPTIHAQPLFNGKVAFPALEDLSIWEVPMIRDIWPQQPLLKPEKEVESFCKLKYIRVWSCEQLEYVLPSNMLPQLHNLLKLEIIFCKELEVIVSNKLNEKEATNNDILVFPQLKDLELWGLDSLKCFCTGTDQILFSHKVAFPALERLWIWNTPSITEIWDKKPLSEPEQEIESFSKLETIFIWDCHQLVYVLPSYMLPRLQNLQELEIKYCKEVEVIVSEELKEKEAADNDPIVFSQLKDVEFDDLPKLKGFYTGTQLIFFNKVAFPALEHLTITKVPKIKEIWDKQPLPEPEKKPKSFDKLMSIHVEECDQLVYVFPSYMLPQLQNLQKLAIGNCKEMEVIISNKLKDKEVTNNDIILFAELKTVILQNLPNLKRLCAEMQLAFSTKDAFPVLEINKIEVAKKKRWELRRCITSCIDPDLTFLVDGTSRKEVAIEIHSELKTREEKKNEMAVEHPMKIDSSFNNSSIQMNGSTDHVNSDFTLNRGSPSGSGSREAGNSGLRGLDNLGNTCFMNSAIQCLVHTSELVDHFKDYQKDINTEESSGMKLLRYLLFLHLSLCILFGQGELAFQFGDLLRKLRAPEAGPVSPEEFKSKLAAIDPRFNDGNQHDSQEFLAFLLNELHGDLNCATCKPIEAIDVEGRPDEAESNKHWLNHLSCNTSIIVDLFHGQCQSKLVCPVCETKSSTFERFQDLSLPLPPTESESDTITLDQCLQTYVQKEILGPKDEWLAHIPIEILGPKDEWNCPNCKTDQPANKKLDLWRLPKILIIHLKRFSNKKKKLETFVDFPIDDFDLSGIVRNSQQPHHYVLYAVIKHYGDMGGGHYTASVQVSIFWSW